jgi:Co/Zn/Cd efflux system component
MSNAANNSLYGVVGLVTATYCIYEVYVAISIDSLTLLSDGLVFCFKLFFLLIINKPRAHIQVS